MLTMLSPAARLLMAAMPTVPGVLLSKLSNSFLSVSPTSPTAAAGALPNTAARTIATEAAVPARLSLYFICTPEVWWWSVGRAEASAWLPIATNTPRKRMQVFSKSPLNAGAGQI